VSADGRLLLVSLAGVLDMDIEQYEVTEFDRMDRHDATLSQITSPILVCVLVIDSILHIVW
jgi:ABC-type polysaccharide transport system permease subunit